MLARADVRDAEGLFRAGAGAVRQGLEREALPLLERGVRLHARDARIWQLLGLAWRNLEEPAPALDALRRAAALAPADPLIAHTLARATLEAGLPAITLFERAQALAPQDGSLLLGRSAAQLAEGRIAEAIADLDALLARNPLWLDGHAAAARLRGLSGAGADFAASYERALAVAPREHGLWLALVGQLVVSERYAAAEEVVARARAAAGDHPAHAGIEALCAAELGRAEEAERRFAALGEIADPALAVRKVRHLLRTGRPAEAAALAWRHRDAPGDLMWPYLALAWRLTADPRWQWLEGDSRFVTVHDLDLAAIGPLAARLRALHTATHQPPEQSVRGGTQTDGPLFARIEPEIRALRATVKAAVERHVAQLPPPDPSHPILAHRRDAPLRFAGSWSVRLAGQGFHSDHVHPAGWISSALYVSLPEGMGGADHAGWLSLGEAPALGLALPPIRLVEPRPGRLVLFPSTMWHGTRPFASGERLTVAFDVARPAA